MPRKKSSRKSAPSKPSSPVFRHASKLPIKSVAVVGAGGNGSIFISHLCRIWQAWTKLGGAPFKIEVYDDDLVSDANLARQCFCEADIGMPKALILAQRMNAFYGVPIVHKTSRYKHRRGVHHDVIVGCVDNIATRKEMAKATMAGWVDHGTEEDQREGTSCYWLDLGNSADSGQVVLGGHGLMNVFNIYPRLARQKDPADLPSCSMAEALARQDLFINSTLATLGGHLLWKLMRNGGLNHHGYIVNLGAGVVLPIKVP